MWNLPVSFTRADIPVSLRKYIHPTEPVIPVSELTSEQWYQLTVLRIEGRSRYAMTIFGVGTLDKERSLIEVRGRSPIGQVLLEIERTLVKDLIDHASRVQ
jgi:hypothetical protein